MSKKQIINFFKIALPLLLGVFLIWYSYNKFTPGQLSEIKAYFREANYSYVFISLIFGLLSNLSRAWRWNYLLEPLGYKTQYANNVMAVYITYLMNLFIPRSGEVSRAVVINKYENIPFEKAFGTIISERVADLVVLVSLVTTALVMQFSIISQYLIENVTLSKFYTILAILFPLAIIAILFLKFSKSLFIQKVKLFLKGLKEGIFSIAKMKNKWAFIAHTLFIWLMYVTMFYIMIFALEETANISLTAVLCAFVVGGLTITFTNGGFGSYPFFIAGILLLFGVPETAGTAFGWLVWTSQTAAIVILGGLSFLLLPVFNKPK